MTAGTLPTETRPIRIDPELGAEIEKILKGLKGKDLEAAQGAVMKVYHSGVTGSFGSVLDAYRTAIEEAVTAP